jgi:DNA-binding beta-propeller fold protein YncE
MAHITRVWRTSLAVRLSVLIVLFGTATQLVLSRESRLIQNGTSQTKIIGKDRLVSVEPLPEMNGEFCEYPVTPSPQLMAALQQQGRGASSLMASLIASSGPQQSGPARPSDALRSAVAKRQPLTTIKDPRDTFAGLFVDPVRNEVVMAEENNFSIMVYERTENTPRAAALSEPKRTIRGVNTFLEYACSVYVDPETGHIYAVNNDTLTWMTVFDRNAKGNSAPIRKVAVPQSSFGIVADEEAQEILMTIQDEHAVVTYKKMAKDQEPPVRLLQGTKTLMADPHGIALDPKTGLIYVTNWGTGNQRRHEQPRRKANWPTAREFNIPGSGYFDAPSITVYRKDAQGDVAPLRVIQGPRTLMNWPTSIAVHPDRGEIFVANDTADNITVYRADANGDAAPIRVLKGPRSMIKNPTGVALDLKNNELWVTNFGNHTATVFPVDAAGDPAPKRLIRSAPASESAPMLSNPHTIAFDTKRDQLLVSN